MSTPGQAKQDPRRLFLFMVLSFALILGTNLMLDRFGLLPKPEPPAPLAKTPAKAEPGAEGPPGVALADKAPTPSIVANPTKAVPVLDPERIVLGSVDGPSSGLEITLDQRGAGVSRIRSADFNAEYPGNKHIVRPLTLLRGSNRRPLPFALEALAEVDGQRSPIGDLERRTWDVLIGDRLLSELSDEEREDARPVRELRDRQEVVFRTTLEGIGDQSPVEVTKTYRLPSGAATFDVVIDFKLAGDASKPGSISYRFFGPYGLPIEGEWYTSTFRNAFMGKAKDGEVSVETHAAYEVANGEPGEYVNTQLPIAFAGVENQYFAVLFRPLAEDRIDAETTLVAVETGPDVDPKKADMSVELVTTPFELAPGVPIEQTYRVYAGPKEAEALAPFKAGELANYRTIGRVPIIGFLFDALNFVLDPPVTFLSNRVIGPLLGTIYGLTKTVAGWFGGTRGSYGIAIILLTFTVRLFMFPISRKQAMSAKRMQDLQPHMAALREKYGEDREKIASETFALYRKFGINPVAGCLPVLFQIPIFMSLWRTLNVSVALRQAPFLWMDNLAAPDMLFGFGREIPLLGPYFNLLPLAVIGLMLLQTKLFAPPVTTPEQEQQQKIMKYMMIGMGFMFYRVPSGLSIYFITSSLWSIGERLLLPKITKGVKLPSPGSEEEGTSAGKAESASKKPAGAGWLSRKLEDLMAEAERERTHRRESITREGDRPTTAKPAKNDEIAADGGRRRPDPGRPRPGGKRR